MPTHDSYDDLFRDTPTDGASHAPAVTLRATQERSLIRPHGSKRHVVFTVSAPQTERPPRRPLTLALVLDRSGSMAGQPLEMAKAVALRLIYDMTPEDQVAVVAFDDQMTVIQELAPVTDAVKGRVAQALARLRDRGSTALYEGWLTGCKQIVGDTVDYTRIAHVLLLTDGQANIGLTSPDEIAKEVAELRSRANIGTDTYGLGEDYDQDLLSPMAMAGEGHFTHLRTPRDLEGAFRGVVADLRGSVATCVRLELAAGAGIEAKVVSAYWSRDEQGSEARWSVGLGEMAGGDERQVVVRYTFPGSDEGQHQTARARLVWMDERGEKRATPWQETRFTYATDEACTEESRNPEAMRVIELTRSDRVKERVSILSDAGDATGAADMVDHFVETLKALAAEDPMIAAELEEMQRMSADIKGKQFSKMSSKEAYFQAHRRMSSRKDYRDGSQE